MNLLVIDVQGFNIENNKFITKELAAYDGDKLCHYIFKAPFDIKYLPSDLHKQALWLMKNHHCIDWNEGFTPLHKFVEIIKNLTEKVDHVYVKGNEKAKYIRQYSLKPVFELDEDPKIKKEDPRCFYHSKSPSICALTNVYFFYNNCLMIE